MNIDNYDIEDLAQRLLSNSIENEEGCWIWQGAKDSKGYPKIRLGYPKRLEYAHRLSYEVFGKGVPEHWGLYHECRNKSCINPEHLLPGTTKVNGRRRWFDYHTKEAN